MVWKKIWQHKGFKLNIISREIGRLFINSTKATLNESQGPFFWLTRSLVTEGALSVFFEKKINRLHSVDDILACFNHIATSPGWTLSRSFWLISKLSRKRIWPFFVENQKFFVKNRNVFSETRKENISSSHPLLSQKNVLEPFRRLHTYAVGQKGLGAGPRKKPILWESLAISMSNFPWLILEKRRDFCGFVTLYHSWACPIAPEHLLL